MQNLTKRLIRWAVIVALLLLIPLVLTIRDGGVEGVGWNWTPFDFVVMGSLLFGSALTYELIARKMTDNAYRIAVGVAVTTSLLLVWINAAVGIIGNEGNDANLMYFGVLAIGIIIATVTRFQPEGMARALFATAFAQATVALIALFFFASATPGPLQILALNGFFVASFLGSALLFRHATRKHGRPMETVKAS
jgi:hypothetical protein